MSSIISFTPAVGWAQLHRCPASSRFCNSAITVRSSFMCNELVITVFPLGPVLASYFHLKAAHMSTDAERPFFTCLKFTSVVQSNCCQSLTASLFTTSSSTITLPYIFFVMKHGSKPVLGAKVGGKQGFYVKKLRSALAIGNTLKQKGLFYASCRQWQVQRSEETKHQ